MSRIPKVILAAALTVAASAAANAAEPIALRDMGSFHVGGRLVEISGKPVKEVTFTPGGVPAKVDPNGTYQVEQMYVQYFLPANERGAFPLLLWHGGGLTVGLGDLEVGLGRQGVGVCGGVVAQIRVVHRGGDAGHRPGGAAAGARPACGTHARRAHAAARPAR